MLRTKQEYLIHVYGPGGSVVVERRVTQAVLPVRKAQKLVRSCSAVSYKIFKANDAIGQASLFLRGDS